MYMEMTKTKTTKSDFIPPKEIASINMEVVADMCQIMRDLKSPGKHEMQERALKLLQTYTSRVNMPTASPANISDQLERFRRNIASVLYLQDMILYTYENMQSELCSIIDVHTKEHDKWMAHVDELYQEHLKRKDAERKAKERAKQ